MPEAFDICGSVFKNGTVTLLARIVGASGANITPGDIDTVTYTVYLLDDQDADARSAVEYHTEVALNVEAVIFSSLQLDDLWTVDQIGYNFRHELDVSAHPAFTIAGRRYLVEYRLQPLEGQVILVRFRLNAI